MRNKNITLCKASFLEMQEGRISISLNRSIVFWFVLPWCVWMHKDAQFREKAALWDSVPIFQLLIEHVDV